MDGTLNLQIIWSTQPTPRVQVILNTSYLAESYIAFTLKMESVTKITIFGLKMMVKRGGKIYFEIPPCGKMVIFITEFVILGTFMK